MCGISGWVNWSNYLNLLNEVETIEKMNHTIFHRGPEEGGFWKSSNALLGHRRLCVIDAAGGKQPMVYKSSDKSIVLCFNGELYNFQDLRKELEGLGHKFKSYSDTEVILLSYVQWGEECVKRFNGMFAVVIFDETKSKLFLARDHLGIKPLFYCTRGESIIFGSEIKVLLANDLVKPEVDKNGLAQLFYLGAFRTPEIGCVYKDINELSAGKTITFYKSGDSFTSDGEVEYWNLKCIKHDEDLKGTEKKLRELMKGALSKQLVSDRPITFLLSGGIASSILVSLATSLAKSSTLPEPSPLNETSILKTFSCEFENDEKDYKETIKGPKQKWIEQVVDNIQSEHVSTKCTVDILLDNLLLPMRARDLPSFAKWETPLRMMLKKVKEKGVVLISDEGSDEIFSGYEWFKKEESLNMNRLPWIGECYVGIDKFLKDDVLKSIDYKRYGEDIYKKATENIPLLEGESEFQIKQRIQSWLFIKYFLIYMLEREDRTSMSNSLEVRVPYCDFNLVEYCWNIPDTIKSVDDVQKGILRRSMANQLPNDILYHKKDTYPLSIQDTNYFYGICNILEIILRDGNSPILDFIKIDQVREIIENKNNQKYQTIQTQILIEHLIQVNNWIIEYKIQFV